MSPVVGARFNQRHIVWLFDGGKNNGSNHRGATGARGPIGLIPSILAGPVDAESGRERR